MTVLREQWENLYKVPPTEVLRRKVGAFAILDEYKKLSVKERKHQDNIIAVCGAARAIANIVEKGLSKRVKEYLEEDFLPEQADRVLRANLLRMESY